MAQNPLGLCLLKVYNERSFQAMVKNSFGLNFDIFVVLKVGCSQANYFPVTLTAPLHSGVKMGTRKLSGGLPCKRQTSHPGGRSNTPSHFVLWKLG